MKEALYCQLPEVVADSEMRQVFLYAAHQDSDELHALAEQIRDLKTGVKCLVKWVNPKSEVNEEDLRINLSNSQVLLVLITPALLSEIRINKKNGENGLPLPVKIMQELKRPYFPIATESDFLEPYCKLDKLIHGLSLADPDFASKLKEQLGKYVLDEELVKEIQQKAFIDQIFMSYRKMDTEVAQKLMSQTHDFPDFDAISIWYDRFLTAGEAFNEEIFEAIDKSTAFIMVITPNITSKREDGQDNFVVAKEYPRAKKSNRLIVPINAGDEICDLKQLHEAFEGIEDPASLDTVYIFLRNLMPSLPRADSYNAEQLYYRGRAYFAGYYFEHDTERAIRLLEQSAKKLDEYALKSAIWLAELYESGGSPEGIVYDKALIWRLRASVLSKKKLGLEHPDTATSYNNIAVVYDRQGDYPKALELYEKALAIREKVLGVEHPDTATSYNNIAGVYDSQGDYPKALEWYEKAFVIIEKTMGIDHPYTIAIKRIIEQMSPRPPP